MTDLNTIKKNALISRRILACIAAGMDVKTAVDAVLGAGTIDRIISEVYDELRAQAAA